jgi:hypothetical protein
MRTLPPDCVEIIERMVTSQEMDGDCDNFADLMKTLGQQTRADLLCYWDSRLKGSSQSLAEMFALQAAPLPKTDSTFLSGFGANGAQFQGGPMAEEQGNHYKRVAEAGGQNVTGKVYLASLAKYPGDPRAWISDRGDVRRVVEERGWTCEGDVQVGNTRASEIAAFVKESPDKPFDGGIDKTEKNDGNLVVLEPAA